MSYVYTYAIWFEDKYIWTLLNERIRIWTVTRNYDWYDVDILM